MKLVIDASVAVEILLRTPLGLRLVERVEAATTTAPELLDAEVLAVLHREVLGKRLDPGRASEALADLRDWDVERVPNRLLVEDAWSWRNDVSACDALYAALAVRVDATVLTADGPLSRAPLAGVFVENVRGPAL